MPRNGIRKTFKYRQPRSYVYETPTSSEMNLKRDTTISISEKYQQFFTEPSSKEMKNSEFETDETNTATSNTPASKFNSTAVNNTITSDEPKSELNKSDTLESELNKSDTLESNLNKSDTPRNNKLDKSDTSRNNKLDKNNASRNNKLDRSDTSRSELNNNTQENYPNFSDDSCTRELEETNSSFSKSCSETADENYQIPEILTQNLRTIKYMIRTINYFIRKLRNSDGIEDIESITTSYYSAFTYNFYYFIDALKHEHLESKFIYNDKIRGKSGSLIFFSSDFSFAIKIIRQAEFESILKNIHSLEKYHSENKETFIVKYLGIYKLKIGNKIIYFVMMKNIMNGLYNQIYDLKGYKVHRTNTSGILTENQWLCNRLVVYDKNPIIKQITKDSEFLCSLNLMDYSLILCKAPANSNSDFRLYNGQYQVPGLRIPKSKMGYSIGIVDTLTEYTTSKWLENMWNTFCCRSNMSSVDPISYKKRFVWLATFQCFESLENDEHKQKLESSTNKFIRERFSYSQDNLFESGEELEE